MQEPIPGEQVEIDPIKKLSSDFRASAGAATASIQQVIDNNWRELPSSQTLGLWLDRWTEILREIEKLHKDNGDGFIEVSRILSAVNIKHRDALTKIMGYLSLLGDARIENLTREVKEKARSAIKQDAEQGKMNIHLATEIADSFLRESNVPDLNVAEIANSFAGILGLNLKVSEKSDFKIEKSPLPKPFWVAVIGEILGKAMEVGAENVVLKSDQQGIKIAFNGKELTEDEINEINKPIDKSPKPEEKYFAGSGLRLVKEVLGFVDFNIRQPTENEFSAFPGFEAKTVAVLPMKTIDN